MFETFQNDVINLLMHVRKNHNIYSEPYQDAVELLMHFLKKRDEIVINIESDALNFSMALLTSLLETEPYSYSSEQRLNVSQHYLELNRSKLKLCENYNEKININSYNEDVFERVTYKSHVYHKGDCVKIK